MIGVVRMVTSVEAEYEGFALITGLSDEQVIVHTGDPVADFDEAMEKAYEMGLTLISLSSSIDEFVAQMTVDGEHVFEWYEVQGTELFRWVSDELRGKAMAQLAPMGLGALA